MQRFPLFGGALAVVGALAGCDLPRDIKPVPVAAPVQDLGNAKLAPIELARVTLAIPRGKQIGISYDDTISCGGRYSGPLYWTSDRANGLTVGLADAFYRELTAAKFNVIGDPKQQFNTSRERADYLVGAQVTNLDVNICDRIGLSGRRLGLQRGEAAMDVTWQVFSNQQQRVVYTTRTRGYSKLESAVADGDELVAENAFAAAATNLAGDKGFVDLLRRDQLVTSAEPPPVPDAALKLEGVRLLADPIARNVSRIRDATVTLLIGDGGHGSGFFITDQGYLLTNYHVVGEGETVPVQLSNGTTIAGRVLRRNKVRDIALVKVDAVGNRALAVRNKPVAVAEEVYAIGTPLERDLRNSLTKGIVNALRRSDDGTLIQSDALITHGNSGGPLLDASGNVVGVAVSGIENAAGRINFFIPIGDALQKLNIELGP